MESAENIYRREYLMMLEIYLSALRVGRCPLETLLSENFMTELPKNLKFMANGSPLRNPFQSVPVH